MNKQTIVIWIPAFLGFILLLVTQVDIYQFASQSIGTQTMLSREVPIVIVGLLLGLAVFLNGIYWLIKKQWFTAIQAIISPLVFLLLFVVSGALGGAFLNAT